MVNSIWDYMTNTYRLKSAAMVTNGHSLEIWKTLYVVYVNPLTLILLTWRIGWAHNNARK